MRFRVRAVLPSGQPLIVKPDVANAFEAAAAAATAYRSQGTDLSTFRTVTIKPMKGAGSSVYVGKVPTSRKGKSEKPEKKPAAEKPTAAKPAAAPAKK